MDRCLKNVYILHISASNYTTSLALNKITENKITPMNIEGGRADNE